MGVLRGGSAVHVALCQIVPDSARWGHGGGAGRGGRDADPLPVMTLTKEQGYWITKELYRKLLPEMGVNRNFSRANRHTYKMFQEVVIT